MLTACGGSADEETPTPAPTPEPGIMGVLQYASGEPVAELNIRLDLFLDSSNRNFRAIAYGQTDSEGAFAFTGIAPGDYAISVVPNTRGSLGTELRLPPNAAALPNNYVGNANRTQILRIRIAGDDVVDIGTAILP